MPCGICIGRDTAKRIGVPSPHQAIVGRSSNFTRCAEMIGVHVVDRNGAAIRLHGGNWRIPHPNGLLNQRASAGVLT